jgi:hypothetical protein
MSKGEALDPGSGGPGRVVADRSAGPTGCGGTGRTGRLDQAATAVVPARTQIMEYQWQHNGVEVGNGKANT